MRTLALAALLLALWPTSECRACVALPTVHTLDPVEMAEDSSPPGAVEVLVADVIRGQGPQRTADCGLAASSTDGTGTIALQLSDVVDDRTASEQMGFALHVVDGEAPDFFSSVFEDALRAESGFLYLSWDDGAKDDQESFDFTLRITPVDLGGNEGPATLVEVSDPGRSSCGASLVGTSTILLPLLALLLLVSVLRRSASAIAVEATAG